MSTEEAYLRATDSSHLEWKPSLADVDRLVAAGLVRESLGTRLIRLRAEFDSLSGTTLHRVSIRLLRSFPSSSEAILTFAITEATRRGVHDEEAVKQTAAKVLDLFLDPNCPQCDGKGFTGQYGSPQLRCAPCRESGKRRAYWKSDAQEEYASWLQANIDAKIARSLGEMSRLLR